MTCILIVDDDETVSGANKILLIANGFDVVAVASGKAAIDAIKIRRFDLVIIDLFMPGINGLETTKAILRDQPLLPVIVVSGFFFGGTSREMPDFETMAIEAGAKAVQYKPIRPKVLLEIIKSVIGIVA